jgi:YD repeat-containing protein
MSHKSYPSCHLIDTAMRNVLIYALVLCFLLLAGCSKSSAPQPSAMSKETAKIKSAKVQSQSTLVYDCFAGKPKLDGIKISSLHYDREGNLTRDVQYTPDGSIRSQRVYAYDANGNKIVETWYKGEKIPIARYAYTYDANNRLLTEQEFAANGSLMFESSYRYDEKGNLAEKFVYSNAKKLLSKQESKYDVDGFLTEQSWKSPTGDTKRVKTFQNNKKTGAPERQFEYDYENNFFEQTVSRYNAKGMIIENSRFDMQAEQKSKTTYNYNNDGLCIEESVFNADNLLINKFLYAYGTHQLLSEKTVLNAADEKVQIIKYEYEYYP